MSKRGTMIGVIWALAALFVSASGMSAFGEDQDLPLLSPECEFQTDGKVVVVGDVYTDFDGFLRILASQNLIDHNNNWIAEDAHLVQTGNILPRDSDWKRLDSSEFEQEKVARFLMNLQKQARAQGGDVHVLQGMLETMYQRWRMEMVPIGLSKIWAGPDSEERAKALHERWLEDLKPKNAQYSEPDQARLRQNMVNYLKAFYQAGCVEYLERIGKYDAEEHRYVLDSEFAQWFRSLNTVIRINDVIYSHVGISPKMAGLDPDHPSPPMSLKQINDMLRERNSDPTLFLPVDADQDGPIWWRVMPQMDDVELRELTSGLKRVYNAKAFVIGLPADRMIVRRGDVFFMRSGLGSNNFRTKLNVLVIEGDHWTIIEERRAVEEGDFGDVEVLEGGPEGPMIPGGGVPRMRDPGGGE